MAKRPCIQCGSTFRASSVKVVVWKGPSISENWLIICADCMDILEAMLSIARQRRYFSATTYRLPFQATA